MSENINKNTQGQKTRPYRRHELTDLCFKGDLEGLVDLFETVEFDAASNWVDLSVAFDSACGEGHEDIVNFFLNTFKNNLNLFLDIQSLLLAAEGENENVLKTLAPLFTGKKVNLALMHAIDRHSVPSIRALLPFADYKENNSSMLRIAVQNRCPLDIIKILAPHFDPKDLQSAPLAFASALEQEEVFNFLYPLSDPKEALVFLKIQQYDTSAQKMITSRLKIDEEKDLLSEHTSGQKKTKPQSGSRKI